MVSSPEMRFLMVCCSNASCADHTLIEDLPAPNWPMLLRLANWHGVMPLLVSRLLPSGATPPSRSDVPDFAVSALRGNKERHLFRGLTQSAALVELQREFDDAHLRILPWKGPSVGTLLYGAATLRDAGDLDFLFLEKDLHHLLEIVRRLGYRLLGDRASESRYLYTLTAQGEFTFGRARDQGILEFHLWILPSRFSRWKGTQIDVERASTICRLAGYDFLVQNPEDLLVSLCAHATKHKWDRLKWSCDIAQFLSVYGDTIDWPAFLTQLEQTQKHLVVLLGLGLAAKLFDMSLPAAVQNTVQRNTRVSNLVNHVADHIMSGSTGPIAFRHEQSMIALLCPRLRDRIAYRLRPIVELNYVDLHVPVHKRKLFFMNYIFRAVRLLRKYGPYRLATKTAASVRSGR